MVSENRRRFRRELIIIGLTAIAVTVLFNKLIYPLTGLTTPAPRPIRTIVLSIVITLLLRQHGESWDDLGLRRPDSLKFAAALVVVFLVAKIFIVHPVGDFLASGLGLEESDQSVFSHIHGNLPAYLFWLAVGWIAGGFGEEMLLRGYLMGRFALVMGGDQRAWIIALFLQAFFFGLGHAYLGAGGIVSTAFGALAYGHFSLLAGRNLWPVILVHGLWDTFGFTLIYLNGVSSMG